MKTNYGLFRISILAVLSLIFFQIMTNIPSARADEKTAVYTVIGESGVYTDIASARNAAISECLQSAVENAAIAELPLELLTQNFQAISTLLADRKNEFVIDYKVLQESTVEKQYRALVQVTVSVEKMHQELTDAGILSTPGKMPQVLFLIAEQYSNETSMQYWWQNKRPIDSETSVSNIKEILQSKGFPVISSQFVPRDMFDGLHLTAQPTNQDAIDLGKKLFADVVIVGTAVAVETQNRMGENIRSLKGTINVRVLFTDTGDKIGPIEKSASAVNSDATAGSQAAIADAGQQIGEELASKMLSKWQELQSPTGEITLNIMGKDVMSHLIEFRNTLKNIDGVSNQRTLEIAPDKAVLSVSYQKDSQELADAILLQTFKGFSVNIYEITNRKINIEFIVP